MDGSKAPLKGDFIATAVVKRPTVYRRRAKVDGVEVDQARDAAKPNYLLSIQLFSRN